MMNNLMSLASSKYGQCVETGAFAPIRLITVL